MWAFYPVFAGTIISMAGWIFFVRREHDAADPATLSELAARSSAAKRYYRAVLWVCGPLFGLTALFFAGPKLQIMGLTVLWLVTVVLEMLVGVFLPSGKRQTVIHEIVAYSMAGCMIATGVLLAVYLPRFALIEWLLVCLMAGFAVTALFRRTRFVFYELGFIFASHLTMVVAVLAVR